MNVYCIGNNLYILTLLVIHIISVIFVWFSELPVNDALIVSIMISLGFVICYYSKLMSSGYLDKTGAILIGMIHGYYIVAILAKIPVILFFNNEIDVPGGGVDTLLFYKEFVHSFSIFVVGFIGFVIGVFLAGRGISTYNIVYIRRHQPNGLLLLLLTASFLLALKILSQLFWRIGIPGVEPIALPIPMVTGVIWLMSIVSTFLAVNFYLFYAISNRRKLAIFIGLSLVLINVADDLMVGIKSTLMYEVFVLIWYYLHFRRPGRIRYNELFILLFIASFAYFAVFIYKYINFYRYALISGMSMFDAIQSAISANAGDDASSMISILNRINGLDTIIISMALIGDFPLSFSEYLTNGAVNAVRYAVYGDRFEEILSAFGTTQFVPSYMIWGEAGVFVFFILLGFIESKYFRFLASKKNVNSGIFFAIQPVLVIEYIKIIFSSGGFDLIVKTLFMFALTTAVLSWLVRLKFYNKSRCLR